MNVKLTITRKGYFLPRGAIEFLHRKIVTMPSGHEFRLNVLNIDVRDRSKFVDRLELEFTVAVGYVGFPFMPSSVYNSPDFKQQKSWFQEQLGEFIVDIRTAPEVQVI